MDRATSQVRDNRPIEDALYREGDEDVRAGLAWLSDEAKIRIAEEAIKAASTFEGPSSQTTEK